MGFRDHAVVVRQAQEVLNEAMAPRKATVLRRMSSTAQAPEKLGEESHGSLITDDQ